MPLGSAMAAALAAGVYGDFDEAARAMVFIERPGRARSERTRAFMMIYSNDMSLFIHG